MPLNLECFCPGDNVYSCDVNGLDLHYTMTGGIEFGKFWVTGDGVTTLELGVSTGSVVPLSPLSAWLDAWDSIVFQVQYGTSLRYGTCSGLGLEIMPVFGNIAVSAFIRATFLCINLENGDEKTITRDYAPCSPRSAFGVCTECIQCDPPPQPCTPLDVKAYYTQTNCSLFISGASTGWSSSLAADCPVIYLPAGSGWLENPRDANVFDPGDPRGEFCLCASGGTEPYRYYVVSGDLCGQSLNYLTGCVTGDRDPNCKGDGVVTFGVMDSLGATATVECDFQPKCTPGNGIGNVFR